MHANGQDLDTELLELRKAMRDDETLRELPVAPDAEDYAKAYADALHRTVHRDDAFLRVLEALRDENRANRREIAALRRELNDERVAAKKERDANASRHAQLVTILSNMPGYR